MAEVKMQALRLAKRTVAARARGHLAPSDLADKAIKKSLSLATTHIASEGKALKAPETRPAASPPRPGSAPITRGRMPAVVLQRLKQPKTKLYVDPSWGTSYVGPPAGSSLKVTGHLLDADVIMCDVSSRGDRRLQLAA